MRWFKRKLYNSSGRTDGDTGANQCVILRYDRDARIRHVRGACNNDIYDGMADTSCMFILERNMQSTRRTEPKNKRFKSVLN